MLVVAWTLPVQMRTMVLKPYLQGRPGQRCIPQQPIKRRCLTIQIGTPSLPPPLPLPQLSNERTHYVLPPGAANASAEDVLLYRSKDNILYATVRTNVSAAMPVQHALCTQRRWREPGVTRLGTACCCPCSRVRATGPCLQPLTSQTTTATSTLGHWYVR